MYVLAMVRQLFEQPRPEQPRPRLFSKAEYRDLLDRGYFDRQHVELIGGRIIETPAQRDEHAFAVRLAQYACLGVFAKGFVVAIQAPIDLEEFSEPEPDVMVLAGDLRQHAQHPKHALLIVEVALTSLAYDRVTKGSVYASRAIADYWIINLVENQVEVFRKPVRDESAEFGWSYREQRILKKGDSIAPLAAPKRKIKIASLLPD